MGEMMLQLAKALSNIPAEKYDGWLMGKAEFEIFRYDTEGKEYGIQFINNNKQLAIIKSIAYAETKIHSELTVYLLNNSLVKGKEQKGIDRNGFEFWHCFTRKEVWNFSTTVGDKNSIHYGEKPIVQGLFILDKIKDMIQNYKKIEIKFYNIIYAGDAVYISSQENRIVGYSCGKISFTVTCLYNKGS